MHKHKHKRRQRKYLSVRLYVAICNCAFCLVSAFLANLWELLLVLPEYAFYVAVIF